VVQAYTDAVTVNAYYERDRLLYAAKVRNGYVPQLRREVRRRFKGLEIKTCPFANLPEKKRTQWALTKEEMKNCVWLKPELVTQIEFTEWTPGTRVDLIIHSTSSSLRHASRTTCENWFSGAHSQSLC
jgi:ATP-dependent DNA ligase